jgi:hypothetical protein
MAPDLLTNVLPVLHGSSRPWLGGWRAIDIAEYAERFLANARLMGMTSLVVVNSA